MGHKPLTDDQACVSVCKMYFRVAEYGEGAHIPPPVLRGFRRKSDIVVRRGHVWSRNSVRRIENADATRAMMDTTAARSNLKVRPNTFTSQVSLELYPGFTDPHATIPASCMTTSRMPSVPHRRTAYSISCAADGLPSTYAMPVGVDANDQYTRVKVYSRKRTKMAIADRERYSTTTFGCQPFETWLAGKAIKYDPEGDLLVRVSSRDMVRNVIFMEELATVAATASAVGTYFYPRWYLNGLPTHISSVGSKAPTRVPRDPSSIRSLYWAREGGWHSGPPSFQILNMLPMLERAIQAVPVDLDRVATQARVLYPSHPTPFMYTLSDGRAGSCLSLNDLQERAADQCRYPNDPYALLGFHGVLVSRTRQLYGNRISSLCWPVESTLLLVPEQQVHLLPSKVSVLWHPEIIANAEECLAALGFLRSKSSNLGLHTLRGSPNMPFLPPYFSAPSSFANAYGGVKVGYVEETLVKASVMDWAEEFINSYELEYSMCAERGYKRCSVSGDKKGRYD